MKVKETQLLVKGVFGRNRSVKFKVFTIGETIDPIPADKAQDLAQAHIEQIKLKKGGYTRIIERDVEITKEANWQTRTFMLFQEREIQPWRQYL
jgi:hypothetical protein